MEKKKGMLCEICTGCGLCAGVEHIPHTLTTNRVWKEKAQPFLEEKVRLVTVDIGTTTVAMQLYNKMGEVEEEYVSVNPQTKYGADVLSRILAAEDSDKANDLKDLIRGVLKCGFLQFQKRLGEEESLFGVVAANTTMVYLLMGWAPKELGKAPFHASHLEGFYTDLEGVPAYVFPGLSAFVGGDITSGIYATKLAEKEELTLLIDLGTNGEMVLGNRERKIACSTAAGPAFEGGANKGIWGADMIHLLAILRREGYVDETGLLLDPYFDEGIRIGNVLVTQQNIRAIQLAKAAIAAGIQILAKTGGYSLGKIDRVILAGGFGYYLNVEDAVEIGLLPQELKEKTMAGGNTALAGALRLGNALLSGKKQVGNEILAQKNIPVTEKLNLAKAEGFEEKYLQMLDLKQISCLD